MPGLLTSLLRYRVRGLPLSVEHESFLGKQSFKVLSFSWLLNAKAPIPDLSWPPQETRSYFYF